MTHHINPYFYAKHLFERLGQQREALELLSTALEAQIGDKPFSSIPEDVLQRVGGGANQKLDDALGFLTYHPSSYGPTDELCVPYWQVFEQLWKWSPQNRWLDELLMRDFTSATLNQLYIEPVPAEEHGDSESPRRILAILERSIQEGGLRHPDNSQSLAFLSSSIDLDLLLSVNSTKLRGINHSILRMLDDSGPSATAPTEYWSRLSHEDPIQFVFRALDIIFGDFQTSKSQLTQHFSALLTHKEEFRESFSTAFDLVISEHRNAIPCLPIYFGFGPGPRSDSWEEALHSVLQGNSSVYRVVELWPVD